MPGIRIAREKNDPKALRELQSAKQELLVRSGRLIL
jgi:hypothetical protein